MFEESKGTLVMLGTGMGRLGRAHYEISFEANPASVPFPWVRRGQLWAGGGWPVGKATQTPLVTTLPFSQLSQPLGFPYDHVTDDSIAPRPLKGARGRFSARQEGEAGCPPMASEVSSASQFAHGPVYHRHMPS